MSHYRAVRKEKKKNLLLKLSIGISRLQLTSYNCHYGNESPRIREENYAGQAEGAPIQPNFLFFTVRVAVLLGPFSLNAILSPNI